MNRVLQVIVDGILRECQITGCSSSVDRHMALHEMLHQRFYMENLMPVVTLPTGLIQRRIPWEWKRFLPTNTVVRYRWDHSFIELLVKSYPQLVLMDTSLSRIHMPLLINPRYSSGSVNLGNKTE